MLYYLAYHFICSYASDELTRTIIAFWFRVMDLDLSINFSYASVVLFHSSVLNYADSQILLRVNICVVIRFLYSIWLYRSMPLL